MSKRWFLYTGLLLITASSLAACAAPAASPGQPTPSFSGTLKGTVLYRERIALDPTAVIEVQLLDVSKADAPAEVIAAQTINAEGRQVPIPFELAYDPAQIDERNRYNVSARILVNNELRWISQEAHPVLTQGGAVDEVEILVKRTSAASGGLPEGEFILVSLVVDGTEVALEDGVTTTIQFAAGGAYSGSGGCNRYTGAYTLQGATLSLGDAAATLMACPSGEAQERQFFTALPKITTFETTVDGLRLSSADGSTVLTFTAGAGGQSSRQQP